MTADAPLLDLRDVTKHFPIRGGVFFSVQGHVRAVEEVSLTIRKGETLGLVGESGCGKSTLGKCITRLLEPTSGQVLFEGTDLAPLGQGALRPYRRDIQLIFQDPAESLNPRHNVGRILEEPFVIHGEGDREERRAKVAGLLDTVDLPKNAGARFPFEFSGGQRQRIGIARALALEPKLIICDEPVSALDVSIQSQILNLLLDLQRERGITYLFIAHNLAVVKHIADRIAVMYLGRIMEVGPSEALHTAPKHPYTQALLSAIPIPEPGKRRERIILRGDPPSPIDPPPGCPFHPRCAHAEARCRTERPPMRPVPGAEDGRQVACHFDF